MQIEKASLLRIVNSLRNALRLLRKVECFLNIY